MQWSIYCLAFQVVGAFIVLAVFIRIAFLPNK